jgi:hypothetical protein
VWFLKLLQGFFPAFGSMIGLWIGGYEIVTNLL